MPNSPKKPMSDLVFSQIIPENRLQQFLETQCRMLRLPCAIFNNKGTMLASVGWQEICTQFHRRHPETCARCRASDAHVEAHINNCPKGYLTYPCGNGLWDIAIPIFVENRHFATFFTGQLFYDDTPPDREFFRAQAAHYGFDEKKYLAALDKVPIVSRDYIHNAMTDLLSLVNMIIEMGLENLRLVQEIQQRNKVEQEASCLRFLIKNTRDPI